MPTVISDVHMQNIWGYVHHEIKFLEEDTAQKLCISQSVNFDLPTSGLGVQMPLESMDLDSEGLVNVLYGPNGAGKSTILKIMNDSVKLVDGLVNQYAHQQSTFLRTESALQWIEGKLPSNVSVPDEQGRLKTINFEHNSFVKALIQNFHSPTKKRQEDLARAFNDNPLWDNWEFHSKNKNPISLEIKGIHCFGGVDYRFKLFFEALDLSQYEFGLDALHTPGRISNLGDAGFVVKCDLEKMETTYDLELNESPDGPLMSMYDPVEMGDEGVFAYHKDEQYSSCIPFVIAENFDVIVLGQVVLPLHQIDETDEEKVWPPITTFAWEGSRKSLSQPNPNESELYLRECATEYWFLNPKKVNPEMNYYFEDGREFAIYGGLPSGGDMFSRIEAIKNISQELLGDYAFLGSMSISDEKPKVIHRRNRIQSNQINNLGQYNAIMQLITVQGGTAIDFTLRYMSLVSQIESDDDHLFKCTFLQDIPSESEEFRALMKSYVGRGRYLEHNYGFSKFDAFIPDEEVLRVDYVRNRLEFLFSEGIKRLHHIRKNTEMIDLWQRLTQYQINKKSTHFSKKHIERTDDKICVKYDVLSSGERSLFNLISLLASTEKTGPIYVDEPELSLHPAWQLEIKELVLKIIQYTGRQVFFASHSPDIVIPFTDRSFAIEHKEGSE
jgi:ABC-type cobalamin/Fe3+-siderophores transport system ATPase subunit